MAKKYEVWCWVFIDAETPEEAYKVTDAMLGSGIVPWKTDFNNMEYAIEETREVPE